MADKSKSITNGEGESAVSRVSKLPVVESTLNAASNIYSKVKDSNSMVTSVFNTAENAVFTAKEAVQPITTRLEGPYKKVDSMMCSGLDYVENKIPQIKLPTQELYENAKTTVRNTVQPAVKCVCQSVHKVADLTGLSKICAAGEQCINYVVAKKEETPAVNDSKCTISNKKFPQKPENPAKDD